MSQEVLTHQSEGILTIQINRPDKKNALTQNMYNLIAEGLYSADRDETVRVVVLRGTDDLFSSGNDISDFQKRASQKSDAPPAGTTTFFDAMLSLRKPIIAAVQGYAIGIGTTMLLHCDLVYAGKSAIFSLPFVNLGLCPEFGSSYVLPAMAGQHKAAELFLLGERFSPEVAMSAGIVNRIFDDDTLYDEVMAIARKMAAKSPAALMATKQLMKANSAQTVRQAIQEDGHMFAKLLAGGEAQEAFLAFAEKRAPDFSKF